MKKEVIIKIAIGIIIVAIIVFGYSQMKVKNISIDIDYSKSSNFTNMMRPSQDDIIVVTVDSKIKLTKEIRDKKLLNGYLKCKSSDEKVISVNNDSTLNIKQKGEAEVYCKSILGTKSNSIMFSVIDMEG